MNTIFSTTKHRKKGKMFNENCIFFNVFLKSTFKLINAKIDGEYFLSPNGTLNCFPSNLRIPMTSVLLNSHNKFQIDNLSPWHTPAHLINFTQYLKNNFFVRCFTTSDLLELYDLTSADCQTT